MKALLYCTKAKPYLIPTTNGKYELSYTTTKNDYALNGRIVAICDIETNEIEDSDLINKLTREELLNKSCLAEKQLSDYLNFNNEPIIGYALHISNLEKIRTSGESIILPNNGRAPQNMCYYYDGCERKHALISIRPEWLCKILNGKKTIEVRRKVLKEMIEK